MADLTARMSSVDNTGKSAPALRPFKYYVHDSSRGLRFQLIGDLTEAKVPDLAGCWNTAKTILGSRQLIVDLKALSSADEVGKEWLLSLAHEGATYLPESYFRIGLAAQGSSGPSVKLGFLARLLSVFRSRPVPAESSTRAR